MSRLLLSCCVCLAATSLTSADGVQDNIPENVRRIPEPGVPVPDDRAGSMRAMLGQLQEKFTQINAVDAARLGNHRRKDSAKCGLAGESGSRGFL